MIQKIKIIFLCPYPFDEVASQRFRFEQYFGFLEKHNFRYSCHSFYSAWTYSILYRKNNLLQKVAGTSLGFIRRIIHIFYSITADFVFLHRELTPIGPPVYEWILARVMRKKIIYDFDDAIWLPNTSIENRLVSKLKWHNKFFSVCRWSHKINCCNKFLADIARSYNPHVITIPTMPDPLKFAKISDAEGKERITIGWTGTHSTMPYLSPLVEVIKKVIEQHPNVDFRMICNKEPEWKIQNMQYIPWNKKTEVDDLSGIDIGLMPLPDTDWAEGKCGFKILQYFSMGIPAIASKVGVNKEIIEPGKNGYLCSNSKEWHESLCLLVESGELRKKLGQNGRQLAEETYSPELYSINFLGLFE